MKLEKSRCLNDAERRVLGALLRPDFPGVALLREHVNDATVVGRCDCGCPTIDIEVPIGPVRSEETTSTRLAPFEGRVTPVAGEPPGAIMLFVRDGYLSCLEYESYSDPSPREWPPLDRVTVLQAGPIGQAVQLR